MVGRYVLFNGSFSPQEEVKIHFQDVGFLYGIGAFETLRVYNTRPFKLKEHLNRLKKACQILNFYPNYKFKEEQVYELIDINKLKDGVLKIILTPQNSIIYTDDTIKYPPTLYKNGIKLLLETSYLQNTTDCITKIKSLSFAKRYILRELARKKNAEEVLIFNTEGYLAEASMSNVFLVKESRLFTPSLSTGILPGITREVIITIAKKEDIPLIEADNLTLQDLDTCHELFLTNSIAEILPVSSIQKDDINIIKKDITSNEVTRFLHKKFKEYVMNYG